MDLKLLKVASVLILFQIFDIIVCIPIDNIGHSYTAPAPKPSHMESEEYSKPIVGVQTLLPASQTKTTLHLTSQSVVVSKEKDSSTNSNGITAFKTYSNYYSPSTHSEYNQDLNYNENDNHIISFYDTTTDSSELTTVDEELDNRLGAPVVATLLGR